MMAFPFLLTCFVGMGLRYWLFGTSLAGWFAEQNEIVTPLTSWKRVTEGLSLFNLDRSPYEGDIFHETPLVLRLLNQLNNSFGSSLYILFMLLDLLIAVLLERIAKHHGRYLLQEQARKISEYSTEAQDILLKTNALQITRLIIVAGYLFNPYVVMTCIAKSTAIFNNLAIVSAMLLTLKGNQTWACLWIAVAAYLSFYPIMLVVPAAIFIAQRQGTDLSSPQCISSVMKTVLCTLTSLTALLYISFTLEGSWQFLNSTYGFILSVPDLTPNMGVFWYFFTEMFEHFCLFFLWVFQINAFIYTVPLSIKLRDQPIFLMFMLIALMAIFKSYPSYADCALYLSLIPLWRHVLPQTRNNFIVVCMLMVCSVLAPVLWHLWIYSGSANANFYFAIALVFSTAQIFLVTDLLFAFLRREYDLLHGSKPLIINGKPTEVILE
ncbi:hypothetical protein CAPTEDRAFT_175379 [Capitella teleta]|uniref:Phosphatidylinositol glycan anchor biosynthesis class U protein n=1 Tax=Capitella teleta TaxID=283909 RepID=R7TNP9_CAPTE|nr:hypothetical protein CAPTEDRAFT_175379 [Capitella teleta]|eukprot:ELT93166.1 hypothetical protein CAPTEDRAFT_175379 [Capitella teleta]